MKPSIELLTRSEPQPQESGRRFRWSHPAAMAMASFVFCVLLCGSTARAALLFSSIGGTANPGSSIQVPIQVADFIGVSSAQFTLEWDPAVLQYVGTNSFGLSSDAQSPASYVFNATRTADGALGFAWSTGDLNGKTVDDGTTIFVVEFTVIGSPNSPISFTSGPPTPIEVLDSNFDDIPLSFDEGTVMVVPEPVTCALALFAGTIVVARVFRFFARKH